MVKYVMCNGVTNEMRKRILLILSTVIMASSLVGCEKSNEAASEEINTLQDKYDSLSDDYNELEKKYQDLQSDYDNLKEQIENTTTEETTTSESVITTEEQPDNWADFASDITYDQLSRNPDDYEGKSIQMTGEVVQLMEGEDSNAIRMATDDAWNDILYIEYDPSITEERILEGDKITVYGLYYGIIQYESTLSSIISVPAMYVQHIERK